MTAALPRNGWRAHILPLAILALVLIVSVIVRIRLIDAPLERDEGEHGYMAQTLLGGYAPWQMAYNLKLPGTDMVYALFLALFGQTATAIRLGLLLINIATTLLVALLGRRLFGFDSGAIAGAAYGLLSCGQGVLGTLAHSTHYVVFFAVIGLLLLLSARQTTAWHILTGLIFGIAFLMKQPGLAFGAFGFLYLAWRRRGAKLISAYALGLALPYALLCLALWKAGTFPRFWFWTVTLARAYATQHPLPLQLQMFGLGFRYVVNATFILWILGGLGLVSALLNPSTRRAGLFVGALLAFSFVAVSAGGLFTPHYFVLMLPAVALAIGGFVTSILPLLKSYGGDQGVARYAVFLFLALVFGYSILLQGRYLFRMTPDGFERTVFALDPFPEALNVAEYIRTHTEPGTPIAVLGSEAEIYFYSRRPAATGYLFTYGLMETHEYALPEQLDMIREIGSVKPPYIVFVSAGVSWLQRPGSAEEIFRWFRDYTRENYDIAGVVNLRTGEPSTYEWGPDAAVYEAASPAYLAIYRRRDRP